MCAIARAGLVSIFALVLLATPRTGAAAPVLHVNSGQLVGATGVNVGGVLYDVEFVDGSCIALFDGCDSDSDFDFTTAAAALAASEALLDQVFVDGASGAFDTDPSLTIGCEIRNCAPLTPYHLEDQSGFLWVHLGFAQNVAPDLGADIAFVNAPGDWVRAFDMTTSANFVYARWTAAPVPEPSSLLLLATGAAGALARGRRKRQRR